ncbi:hypothetical protein AQI88_30465 [Streptomyces cellostaticus]|uniref:Uncharacterized protein n=1 Tax=Streptomyces cellostaticus TaxID=67285 RepID=A0A117PUQ0_9ACTN|nr:hypothetical protein [Streptomyces cellostaticus]KUM92706.1 hypothetical protein AQI88_30465 [Streptomyces cellostaticus]GHI06690.1 hypothetical protein Scel_50110 [Streptomyces cellostaticus]
MTDGFMGPPWQMDWRLDARAALEALPEHVREMVYAARAELVTAKDPYFRGIETDAGLPDDMKVRPDRSTDPKGRHICFFDYGNGWLKYVFVRRTEDPQITVEELFWLGTEPPTESPAEE